MKVAANLSFMFGEVGDLLARYKAAKEAGFHAVECAFPYSVPADEVAETLKELKLKQVLINSDPGNLQAGELGFAALPGKEDSFRQSLERSIVYAKALGCGKLHIMSGRRSQHYDEESHVATLEANLSYAVSRLSVENILGLIEPLNPVSTPGYFLNSFETAQSLIEKLNSPHLRLQLDIFHMQMICGNVTNNIKKLMPIVGHIQVAQAPHRHEPSSLGELDYPYIFSVLREAGYEGYVGAEYSPSTNSAASLHWLEKCQLQF
ncbi:putative hydroxypyruvate isomerase [Penaeus japonicus]|uniref:putative hydroxypyruvate isomerase n=1 Tax=Penaeus japonicus TaxID=27405 RepID=UPI001C70B703|nr:putative hydroxypyruvate isomerase [Penaeus japonicus]